MPLRRWSLTLLALLNLLFGRRLAADRRFSELLRRWPGDVWGLAGRAHLRAEACRRADMIADAQLFAQHGTEQNTGLAP